MKIEQPREDDRRSEQGLAGQRDPPFAITLLAALVTMAASSGRQEAEVSFALKRAGLELSQDLQRQALRDLEFKGLIENVIELADGGVLLRVTPSGRRRGHI